MKDVQPFIDLGFYIVPLNGVITRNAKGKKILPPFPKAWKEYYLDTPYNPQNENKPVALTGAFITGKKSGAVSIDCDNEATYDIVKALDPDYKFAFTSRDKPEGGASIVYALNDRLASIEAFRVHKDDLQLDFQTDDLLQFLPTSGNKTKVEWSAENFEDLPELREPPSAILLWLETMYEAHRKAKPLDNGKITVAAHDRYYKHLAPFIDQFVKTEKFNN